MNLPCLDIIIPHYKEPAKVINHLLSSINNQTGINLKKAIRVTIVNDANNEGLAEVNKLKDNYDFNLNILQTPMNGGAGLARQYGLDHTELPYIMFCDADDSLWDCCALMKLLNSVRVLEVKNQQWNYIWSDFNEEVISNNGKGYDLAIHKSPSMIWMHGKIWNRQFLKDSNIRFHSTLRTFEDTYFGKLVALSGPRSLSYHCSEITYLWKKNEQSVTSHWNHDGRSYLYWIYKDYITCTYDVIKFLYNKEHKIERWDELFFSSIYFTYFLLQSNEYADLDNPETKERINALEQLFINIINDFGDVSKSLTMEKRAKWYSDVRTDVTKEHCQFIYEHTNWNQFLDNLMAKYNIDLNDFKLDWIKINNCDNQQ